MEYIDLATLKTALKITDDDRDALLSSAISAASRHIDQLTGMPAPGFGADAIAGVRVFNPWGRIVYNPGGDLLLTDSISSATGLLDHICHADASGDLGGDMGKKEDQAKEEFLRKWAAGRLSKDQIEEGKEEHGVEGGGGTAAAYENLELPEDGPLHHRRSPGFQQDRGHQVRPGAGQPPVRPVM